MMRANTLGVPGMNSLTTCIQMGCKHQKQIPSNKSRINQIEDLVSVHCRIIHLTADIIIHIGRQKLLCCERVMINEINSPWS